MQALQDGEDAIRHLDHLEALYYELQLQLYEVQFEILKYEELLLTAQLQSLRRQLTGTISTQRHLSPAEFTVVPPCCTHGVSWQTCINMANARLVQLGFCPISDPSPATSLS